MMISFCKRSVHSFLGTNDNRTTQKSPHRCRNISSPVDGLSIIAATIDVKKPSHVLESSTVMNSSCSSLPAGRGFESVSSICVGEKKSSNGIGSIDDIGKPSRLLELSTVTNSTCSSLPVGSRFESISSICIGEKKSGIGFIDDIGGGVDGLMSCTESLGFESSDERRTDELLSLLDVNHDTESEICSTAKRNQSRKKIVRSEPKIYPPPLSSLKQNGKPSFYLRPVRKDGRLELTEVRIDRTEILHASRHDGRLRLHLIRDNNANIEKDDEEIEEEEIDEWKLPTAKNGGGGDGFRRCYELVNHHHNNNMHVWRQHCVMMG